MHHSFLRLFFIVSVLLVKLLVKVRLLAEVCDSTAAPPPPKRKTTTTRTVRKSDYTPALALPKHMAGIFDEKCREKEKYREEQIGKCPFSIPRQHAWSELAIKGNNLPFWGLTA